MASMKYQYLFLATIFLIPYFASAQTATIFTLASGVMGFANDVLIPFLLGIAFLFFIINVVKYFVIESTSEDGREKAKNLALYSISAFVFILIFWGIINLLSTSIGLQSKSQTCPDYVAQKGLCP